LKLSKKNQTADNVLLGWTMKSLDADKKASKTSEAAPAEAEKPVEKIDFSKVKTQ
jgi:lysyl-tRNA synthetase class 2